MALTDYEKDWIGYVSGKNITAETIDENRQRNTDKDAFLNGVIIDQLNSVRQEIDDAQGVIITRLEDANFLTAAWRSITNSSAETTSKMKWRADDSDTNQGILANYELRSDVEIDTIADIDERTKSISPEDISALTQSFERIKELEKAMKLQLDDQGEPLFSDTDIRNELWTPLVRSGLIPENIVPDAYSEQAIAFLGAQALYAEKLEAYTETHSSGIEKLKFGLRIGKAGATVIGAIVSNSVTIGNANSVAEANEDIKGLEGEKADLQAEKADPATTSARQTEITAKLDQNKTDIDAKKVKLLKLANVSKNIDLATTLVTGGLTMAEVIVDHVNAPEDTKTLAKWAATFEKGIGIAQSIAVKSAEMGMKNSSTTGGKAEANLIKNVTCVLNASFAGAKLVPKAVMVVQEPNTDKRLALVSGMMGDLADVVANGINAASTHVDHGSTPEQKRATEAERAQMTQVAAYFKLAIREFGNAPAIIAAYKKGDYNAIGMLVLGSASAAAFAASTDLVYNAVMSEQTLEEKVAHTKYQQNYFQTTDGSSSDDQTMETAEDKAIAANLDKIAKSMGVINLATIRSITPPTNPKAPDLSAEALQEEITAQIEKTQQQEAQNRLNTLLNSEEGAQAIMDDADAVIVGFEKMYQDAYPDTDITNRDPEVIIRANEAIDRAMANTTALRQKVALINGISGGAVGIFAALVPGTGAVVAIQKVMADLYALSKCVEVHNAWVNSMEVTLQSQGGSSAAIQNILENATIHLSKASIDIILDTLKAGAEVGKMFDPTGAAAITSASSSMAKAVVDFGFIMQKEAAIIAGWNAYKIARANPKNRKAARKALRLNSTLAKCCIAYGASIMNDTAAKQAIKATGLSIAALQDDKDICKRLVSYLENELADDPVVLMVDYQKGVKWMPGTPELTLRVWTSFKAACNKTAQPGLADASLPTPAIDRLLSLLADTTLWATPEKFAKAKDQKQTEDEAKQNGTPRPPARRINSKAQAMIDELTKSIDYLDRLNIAFSAYRPLQAGNGSKVHAEMEPVAKTLATLARAGKKTAQSNLDLVTKYPRAVTKKTKKPAP